MSIEMKSLSRSPIPLSVNRQSCDIVTLFLFHWIDMKFVIGPDQVYLSFNDNFQIPI
jgi:hypothetical protein